MKNNNHNRFWEIDLLRGIAILMMIIFHLFYDLNYFNVYKVELYSGFSLIFVYLIGTMFFLLVGISLTLSYSRTKNNLTKKNLQLKYLTRGFGIFGLGLLVTLATWIYLGGKGFVVFGVLHCIGLSIIFAYPFLRFRYQNLVLGIALISAGIILKNLTFDFNWLLWLGFTPSNFYTVDYFPLLPWFGVVLIGIFIGNSLYQNNVRKFKLKDRSQFIVVRFTCFLGRHSLIIYLVHQPILIGLLYLFSL
ncbi:MAG: heparan-alpha-glucosaminide N-acetyltransferase [Euryarchaeota archaeon]|nr:heparan-alpha-glucosaminide N-acetyltransferase [Euryarchaeota archaeon]